MSLLWSTTDGDGNVFAYFEASQYGLGVDYGGETAHGNRLAKYNAAGQLVWLLPWPRDDRFIGDVSGNLIGVTTGDAASVFGCATMSMSSSGLYLQKFDETGSCTWGKDFGGSLSEGAIDSDDAGNIYVAAVVSGTVDFGDGPLSPIGTQDIVLAKLSPNGDPIWSGRFGGEAFTGTVSLSVAGNGQVLVGGHFDGALDLGAGPLLAAGGASFIAKLDQAGALVGLHQFSGTFRFAADPGGDALLMSDDTSLDLGEGAVFTTGGLAVAKLRL